MKMDYSKIGFAILRDGDRYLWAEIFEVGGWCPRCDYCTDEIHLFINKTKPLEGEVI
jgi:hypothetical protein